MSKEDYQNLFKDKDYKLLFEELKQKVKEEGLSDKIPVRGTIEVSLVLSIFGLSFYSLFNWTPIITTILFILTFWRSTFIAHDLIHLQYFKNRKLNKNLGYLFGNIIIGISRDWWEFEHNISHHTLTNVAKKDEDIRGLNGIFIEEKRGSKWFHKNKRPIFWSLIFFTWFFFHKQSIKYILSNHCKGLKKKLLNVITLTLHFILVPGMLLMTLETSTAWIMIATIYFVYSFFASLGFITNHLGMEVLEGDNYKKMEWFELQTRTSRNIKGGWLVHWMWGGLNTQVEHHLFPKTPRLNLLKVAKITEDFCKEKGLFYYVTTPMEAFKEIDLELQEKGQFNY